MNRIQGAIFVLSLLLPLSSIVANDGDTTTVVSSPRKESTRMFPSLQQSKLVAAPLLDFTGFIEGPTVEQLNDRQKIDEAIENVINSNRIITQIQPTAEIDFPVGLKVDLGVLEYLLIVDSIVGRNNEADIFASMRFKIPQSNKSIYFKSSAVRISADGNLIGDAKLMLIGDYIVPIDSPNTYLMIKDDSGNSFVTFDCKGYKEMSLNASLVFSNQLLIPENASGIADPNGNVAIDFTTAFSDWNDILLEVNVPAFQIRGLKDVSFAVTGAVLDFSDVRNPLGMLFPANYHSQMPDNTWSGVFVRQASIKLPRQFKRKDNTGKLSTDRITIIGSNLILDNVGFTGKVMAQNLIPLDKGKLGKWNYSVDALFINVVANNIESGGFDGEIKLPLSAGIDPPDDPKTTTKKESIKSILGYHAVIQDGNYLFNVSVENGLKFDAWRATIKLHTNSHIDVKLEDGDFMPKAVLNGEMMINARLTESDDPKVDISKSLNVPKILFQNLVIQSVRPYVTIEALSLGGEGRKITLGGFSLSINEISASATAQGASLGLSVKLNLIGNSDNVFGANGRVKIVAEAIENDSDISYHFKGVEIEQFGINVDRGAYSFEGHLAFFKNDAAYGNGIAGQVRARFKPGIDIQSDALFGTKDGLHYWYVDGVMKFNNGLTLFPGIAAYSFGGGAYYHMRVDDRPANSSVRKVSPIAYIPDANSSLGLKAVIGVGTQPSKQAFNGDFTFEIAFNNHGGVRYINFKGNGYFMTPPFADNIAKLQEKTKKLASALKRLDVSAPNLNEGSLDASAQIHGSPSQEGSRAALWASTTINYDFENRVLHGNLIVYVFVAGGLIKGPGPGGRTGEAVMHFASDEWYIYIGRPEPENRIALTVASLARLDSYFVMGSHIPDSPPPPAAVSSILGNIDLDYMKDLNALADGAGVGFGASFTFDTGDMTFLVFYGKFAAGFGMDAMLKDYGNVSCAGSGQIGVNGWYANTQAYAYFEGAIGIKIKVFGVRKKIPILEIGAAVIAQAKLPNPVWIKGIVGGHYNVLNGLAKGSCKFEVEIGHECEIIKNTRPESALEGLEVISQLTPDAGATNVDVFLVPQVVFNYEVDRVYEITGENDEVLSFKISLDNFVVKDGNTVLQSDLTWNADKTVAALNPFEILPPQKQLTVEATASFKEQRNGVWVVAVSDGHPMTEKKTISFTTGQAPDYIPASNVAYSYPLQNQYNYYKDEYLQGYITLKQGQSYLFANPGWHPVIRISSSVSTVELPVQYVSAEKELKTPLPSNLLNDKIYKLSIVNVPGSARLTANDENVQASTITAVSGFDSSVEITKKSATGTIREEQEKEVYSTSFRTSRHNLFRQKIESAGLSSGWRNPVEPGVHVIGSNYTALEPFSRVENTGEGAVAPLIKLEADLSAVPWFNQRINPLIYSDYPMMTGMSFQRDVTIFGRVPTRAVFLYQVPYEVALTTNDIQSGSVASVNVIGRVDYALAYFMYHDFADLANVAADFISNRRIINARLMQLVTATFPIIERGGYDVLISYVLPGKNVSTSTVRHRINNPLD